MQFRGAHALVTGANSRMGSHFVEALLARGAERVYAAARRIDALADAVENHGDRVVPVSWMSPTRRLSGAWRTIFLTSTSWCPMRGRPASCRCCRTRPSKSSAPPWR